jgi:flagellar motor switch protein FliG
MKPADRGLRAYRAAQNAETPSPPRADESAGEGREQNHIPDAKVHQLLKRNESGARKAAKFLMILPKEEATKILKALDPDEVERVALEIARIRKVDIDEARAILDDFGKLGARSATKRGGPDVAKEMLARAFGSDRGDELFYRTVPAGRINPFDFLDELEFQQILMILKHEPAPVVSVILTHLQPDKAARVLEAMHPDMQRDIAMRVSRLEKLDPEVLGNIAEALRERVRRQGKIVTEEIDGRAALAEILRYVTSDKEDEILSNLEQYDEELSKDIQERLLTIEVVFRIRESDLQDILRDFSDTEIGVILKGKRDDIRSRFFSNLSERRGVMVREEMDRLGPMRRSEVGEATKDFLLYIRDLEEEGRVVIDMDDEYLVD